MKKRYKMIFAFIVAIFIVSFVWFDLFFWQGNNKGFERALADSAQNNNVIIVFNSGGFGTVKPERAWDFQPLINGIQATLQDLGYSVGVVPYYRTEDSLLGKAAYTKEMIFNFPKESTYLATELEKFVELNPQKTVILAGLSNGATFVEATMEKIDCCNDKIFSVEFGSPFWSKKQSRNNILYLNNDGKDSLSNGNVLALSWSIIKAPFIMSYTKIVGDPISFPEAMSVPGHQYYWAEVKPQVSEFFNRNLVPTNNLAPVNL